MINMICAIGKNKQIGLNNGLPWDSSVGDLAYFKQKTNQSIVIMGKRTFESLDYKPLKNRINIVISSTIKPLHGVLTYTNVDECFKALPTFGDVWVIGGNYVWNDMLQKGMIDRVYLSHIEYDGDYDAQLESFDFIKSNFLFNMYENNGSVEVYDRK